VSAKGFHPNGRSVPTWDEPTRLLAIRVEQDQVEISVVDTIHYLGPARSSQRKPKTSVWIERTPGWSREAVEAAIRLREERQQVMHRPQPGRFIIDPLPPAPLQDLLGGDG
jgi:hypothetical protein